MRIRIQNRIILHWDQDPDPEQAGKKIEQQHSSERFPINLLQMFWQI